MQLPRRTHLQWWCLQDSPPDLSARRGAPCPTPRPRRQRTPSAPAKATWGRGVWWWHAGGTHWALGSTLLPLNQSLPTCAAPLTVWAASASAVSRGSPAATPPSASASIMRYTKAGPEPLSPAHRCGWACEAAGQQASSELKKGPKNWWPAALRHAQTSVEGATNTGTFASTSPTCDCIQLLLFHCVHSRRGRRSQLSKLLRPQTGWVGDLRPAAGLRNMRTTTQQP